MVRKSSLLCKPIQVGPLLLSNRMVRAPMHSGLCWESGEVSQQLIDIYENWARNGVSLIAVEETAVDGRHLGKTELRIDEQIFEPGLHRLVEVAHVNGVPIVIQLCHRGVWANNPVSPSGVPCYGINKKFCVESRALTSADVKSPPMSK